MEIYDIVKRPLVTEKGTWQSQQMHKECGGAYAFEVHPDANKYQIKAAVEAIYEVKVLRVRTANRRGKPRRHRNLMSYTPHWKRAVVVLHPDHHIDLF